MDAEERARLRGEILGELAPLLHERFAADAWGRLLVALAREPGEAGGYRVASIDVDEIVGDEAALEQAFGGPGRDELLDVLRASTEALAALAGVDLEQAQGGTLVRRPEGGFAWLPGLVRAPSAAFDARRDGDVRELERRFRELPGPLRSARVDLDAESGRVTFFDAEGKPVGEARGALVGTFSRRSYAWLWGWAHRDLPEPMRRAVKDVLDGILDRTLWEVSERQFGTDEPTAWALCALYCAESKADAALRLTHAEGSVFVALYDVRASGDEGPGGEPGS
ncbi:MAG TPA: hypothetical protein VFS43_44140 [Polyangiaceae bacterium]|nr:hypothetical protein [Polyangiaceae bacterium]